MMVRSIAFAEKDVLEQLEQIAWECGFDGFTQQCKSFNAPHVSEHTVIRTKYCLDFYFDGKYMVPEDVVAYPDKPTLVVRGTSSFILNKAKDIAEKYYQRIGKKLSVEAYNPNQLRSEFD